MAAKNMTDMTIGSPSKHILAFTVPLLIGNIFQQLYNMVDSLIVGNFVGANALAAVGTCGSLNFLCFSLSSGLAIGIGIIVSQFFGAKDEKSVRTTIANSYYVLGIASIFVTLIAWFLSPFLLRLMQVPDSIIADSVIYIRTTSLGIIFVALYNGIASILRALGDSKTPLYFLILSSIVNVVLDLFFVLALSWGVFGVALATIIAQAISAIVSYIYARIKISYFQLNKNELQANRSIIINSFKLGTPIAFQNALIAISCIALQGVVNSFGETVMAAYTIINRIEQLIQQPYGSLGAAITTYSGQNMGANKIERVNKGFYKGALFALIFSLSVLPIAFFLGKYIVAFFVKDIEVIKIGATAMRITSPFYFMLGMIYVPRAVLNGSGDTSFAMINGLTEVFCRIIYSQIFTRITALSLFGFSIPFSFWGIWITTGFTWTTTAIVCVIRFYSGKWKSKSIVN